MNLKTPPIYDFYWNEAPIDWAAVKTTNPWAMIFQASQQERGTRTRWIDSKVFEFTERSRAEGFRDGIYHFLSPHGIAEQAALFLSVWNKIKGTFLPPVVDVEIELPLYYTGTNTVGQAVWQDHIWKFLNYISTGTGRTPMIYTSDKFWRYTYTYRSLLLQPPVWTSDYYLWAAQYFNTDEITDAQSVPTNLPKGWNGKWALWQYSDKGRTKGFSANDLNIASTWFMQELDSETPPPPPPPPVETAPEYFILESPTGKRDKYVRSTL